MDRRREDRFDQRMICQLELNGQSYHGLVLNVSPWGAFVQTRAEAQTASGVVARVEMPSTEPDAVLALEAVVVGQYAVPNRSPGQEASGMGLAIQSVPDAWSELLADLECRKRVHLGCEAMPPVRQSVRSGCRSCGRERATLWSGVCGWCSGSRPSRVIDLKAEPKALPRMIWAQSADVPTGSARKDGVG
jgi:hypothetical protein